MLYLVGSMIIIKTTKGNYTIEAPYFRDMEIYNTIVEQWKNRNNRGFSVELDSNFHLEKFTTILNDDVLEIIRK